MSEENTDFITANIDDCLVAMADGVAKAQEHLNSFTMQAASGMQATAYHIPKVDFELKLAVNFESQTSSSSSGKSNANNKAELISNKLANLLVVRNASLKKINMPLMKVKPAQSTEKSVNSSQAEVVSTIKGSIISIPAYNGKPAPVLSVELSKGKKPNEVIIQALLVDINGEPQVEQAVEFNLDRELSELLNAEKKIFAKGTKEGASPHLNTEIVFPMVETNSEGIATTTLTLDKAETKKSNLAIEVFALGLQESIIYSNE